MLLILKLSLSDGVGSMSAAGFIYIIIFFRRHDTLSKVLFMYPDPIPSPFPTRVVPFRTVWNWKSVSFVDCLLTVCVSLFISIQTTQPLFYI